MASFHSMLVGGIRLGFVALLLAIVVSGVGSRLCAEEPSEDEIKPVPLESATAKINQKNTRIEFVGLHTGDDPKPRLGGFKEFAGVLVFEENALKTISVDIEIESIWTEFEKLTTHLKAADFLGAKEFPTASFRSTSIETGVKPGSLDVTGTLNLHGTETEVTFPVTFDISDKGVVLKSEFKIDRTAFGMNEHADGVEKLVSVSVVVGQATKGIEDDVKEKKEAEKPSKNAQSPAAMPPVSGLAVGASIEPWTPVHVSGPDKGTKTCPLCNYLARPAIVVFAHDSANTEQLLQEIEQLLSKHGDKELKGFVAVLDASPKRVESMAQTNGLLLTALCYPDSETGKKDLAAYNVNPQVDNTVMVYEDYRVVKNFVNLDAKNAMELRKAVESMLQ